ncbi:MAG: SapC family protein [Luminiphilus sp.]|nr:SapC family protein [Luminiphilus sp.]
MDRVIKKLNNIDHAHLSVAPGYSEALGDGVMTCLAYTAEMRALQGTYPLLFQEIAEENHPLTVALMGLEQGENLFLNDGQWVGQAIPMMMQKGPFLIAQESNHQSEATSVIAIDENHPKVLTAGGEEVFSQTGGYSNYLERIITILERIEGSHAHTLAFAEHLTQLKLLTPLEFNLKLENGTEHVLSGFSGIDEDRLIKLNPDELQSLQAQNFLLPLFMVVASQGQMTRLVTLKNQAATAL